MANKNEFMAYEIQVGKRIPSKMSPNIQILI